MHGQRGRSHVVVAALVAVMVSGCGDEAGSGAADTGDGSDDQVTLRERIESSEDCDELAAIRADQDALAEEQDATGAHTGFAIAARARMVAIGCDVEE